MIVERVLPPALMDRIEKEVDKLNEDIALGGNYRDAATKEIATRVLTEFVVEQLVKADNGVLALIVVEGQGLRKRRDERDTEFVKRIVKNYNELLVGTLSYDLLGWKT